MRLKTVTSFCYGAAVLLAIGMAGFALPGFGEEPQSTQAPEPQQDVLHRCWAAEALKGTEAELKPVYKRPAIDLAALKQEVPEAPTPVAPELRGSIRSVALPPDKKLIALTFDLCETDLDIAGYDGRVVDLLRANHAKATFFAGGKWMITHPERAEQLMADPDFEIGSHNWRHLDPLRISEASFDDEVTLAEAAYAHTRKALLARQCLPPDAAVPERMTVMRFPYGTCNDKALAMVASRGMLAIQFDIVTGDPDPHVSAKAIAQTIIGKAHPGAIIVMHANGRGWHTAEGLAIAIPKLEQEGYSFVTVSELIAAGKPIVVPTCYENKPGDNLHMARAARPEGDHDSGWPLLNGLY